MKLTERQIQILKLIIDCYTFSAQPVSSKEIVSKYMPDFSSATIRNEMAALEKFGMLEKTHTSSGRVPSIKGYKFYEENILKPHVSNQIKNQLSKVFVDRTQSIDTVIDQSISIMNEILKLPSVVTTFNSEDLLKRFDLIQLSNDTAMIILVTSNGMINKNTIKFDHPEQLEDIGICIRVFNDRLIDTPLSKVEPKLNSIKEIIRSKVHEYEFCIQQIIKKIFQFNQIDIPKTNVYGTKWLAAQPEFKNVDKLKQILAMLEDTNVWKHISYNQQNTGTTSITFGDEIGNNNISVASTMININNQKHQLSVVGPTRMNYSEVKGILNFIKDEIEKISSK